VAWRWRFGGDDEATAALLAALVSQGVKIVSFSEVSSDLEEIFLRLTTGRWPDALQTQPDVNPIIVKELRSRMRGARALPS